MPVIKVPCGPRETTISHDRWLVVVTVVVWCLLRILYLLRRAWNRRILVRQDSGDAGAQLASPILSYCNGLCFGACYQSSLWAQRNSHFTWPVASCGNGRCLMFVTNMSYQLSVTFLGLFIILDRALTITKGNQCPLPKRVFHVVFCCRNLVRDIWLCKSSW
jgi:hypothetical protein